MKKYEIVSIRSNPTKKHIIMKGKNPYSAVKKIATRLFRDKRRKGPFHIGIKEKDGDKVFDYIVDKKDINHKIQINGKTIIYKLKVLVKAL